MTQIFNQSQFKAIRQKLRNESPRAEYILWQKLRRRQVRGLKFHRQYGICNYVVDFYCPEIKFVIEVDGDTHYDPEAIKKDSMRTDKLRDYGLIVFRFDNNEIYNNIQNVVASIFEKVNDLLANNSLTPPSLPFQKGEE